MKDFVVVVVSSFVNFVRGCCEAVTHPGVFHADDVLAAVLLRLVNPDIRFVRTRDTAAVAAAAIAFDVGEGIWDHHGSAAGTHSDGTPACAVSRLWEAELARVLLPTVAARDYFWKNVIRPVAYQDNGQELPGVSHPLSWIHFMNPTWNSDSNFDEAFEAAIDAATPIVVQLLNQARAAGEAEAVLRSLPLDQRVVEIPSGLPGWVERLATERSKAQFVVFQGDEHTPYYAQCVPVNPESRFSKRTPFPEAWAGKRDAELTEASGILGGVFCHIGRFISGWKTKDAAIAAAEIAACGLEEDEFF